LNYPIRELIFGPFLCRRRIAGLWQTNILNVKSWCLVLPLPLIYELKRLNSLSGMVEMVGREKGGQRKRVEILNLQSFGSVEIRRIIPFYFFAQLFENSTVTVSKQTQLIVVERFSYVYNRLSHYKIGSFSAAYNLFSFSLFMKVAMDCLSLKMIYKLFFFFICVFPISLKQNTHKIHFILTYFHPLLFASALFLSLLPSGPVVFFLRWLCFPFPFVDFGNRFDTSQAQGL